MNKSGGVYRIGTGATSLMMILVILCLTALSVISYTSARSELAVARRTAEVNSQVYAAMDRGYDLVAALDGQVIGYAGAWIILDESHITNIAIAEAFRGNGYGRLLTQALLQYLSNLGASYATLEVRKSNLRAQNLYTSLGFQPVGWRKRYYEDNKEDALIMYRDFVYPEDGEKQA